MEWILNLLHGVQDASISSTSQLTAYPRPDLRELNDSVYELCKPSGSQAHRPSVEIVLFHGLQFDRSEATFLTTWLSKDGSWLPWIFDDFPEARILLISYNGYVEKKSKEGDQDMHITSENLWQDLIAAGVGQDGCPVVLVGHSLGGMVMKEVLLMAESERGLDPLKHVKDKLESLLHNVKQLFYYSCPHNGTRLADIETKFLKGQLLEHLKIYNKEAARCNLAFSKLRRKYKWNAFSIVEALPTDLGQLGRHTVVEEGSARYDTDDYYTAKDADHVNICRPESRTDNRFSKLKDAIDQAVKEDVKGHKVSVSVDEVVGLDDQVRMVRDKLGQSRQVGLFGPGGIGKTTLAKLVYNDMSDNFEYTCFVSEVKGTVTKEADVLRLQAEILKNLYCRGRKVENSTWSTLQGKKVLVGLDDVEADSQILNLSGSGFSTESRVLLTSRDRRVLTTNNFVVHHVVLLDAVASRRLFCNHAFREVFAPEAYKERVESFTQKCSGWPLILKVAGKYLYQQGAGVWDDAFHKLSRAKPLKGNIEKDDFWPIFKVIYYSLDTAEQHMFVDIAICFHDVDLKIVQRLWRVCREYADSGWQNLVDMGLVTAIRDWKGRTNIQMHEVLRDLGRSIACPDGGNIQGHSRVCFDIDSSRLPFEQGNSEVEILKIVSSKSISSYSKIIIDIGELRGLEKLKALWLQRGVRLHGAWNLLPPKLEFLRAEAAFMSNDRFDDHSDTLLCCSRDEKDFPPPHATLRHVETNLGRAFSRPGRKLGLRTDTLDQLKALQYLRLEYCCSTDLPGTGRFNHHGALKYLRLESYQDEALPDSLADLHALEHLYIESWNLKCLPDNLGQLSSLKSLTLVYCGKLKTLPASLGRLKALRRFKIDRCFEFTEIPETLGQLESLRELTIDYYARIERLPNSIGKLQALTHLVIRYCNFLSALPDVFGKLQSLSHLVITFCPSLLALPPTIVELPGLRHLELDCRYLETLRNFLRNLQRPLQHFTVFTIVDPIVVQEDIGQLDAVKHLKVWIGKNSTDRVGQEELGSCKYFEIIPGDELFGQIF